MRCLQRKLIHVHDCRGGSPLIFETLLIVCIFIWTGLIVLGVTQDRNVAEKIGTALLMPTGLLWILMLALTLQLWRQQKLSHTWQSGAIASTACLLLYSVAGGNGFIADFTNSAVWKPIT